MKTLYSHFSLSPFRFNSLCSKPSRPFLCFFSSVASLAHTHTTTPSSNPLLFNYLIETIAFSKPQALSISNRYPWIKTLENPQSVVQFLKKLGFSDTHIRSSIRVSPQILFSNIDKTLKPKLQFFQDLGFTGPDLVNGGLAESYIRSGVDSIISCWHTRRGNEHMHRDKQMHNTRIQTPSFHQGIHSHLNATCYLSYL